MEAGENPQWLYTVVFDSVDTLKDTLRIFCEMVGGIVVKPEA